MTAVIAPPPPVRFFSCRPGGDERNPEREREQGSGHEGNAAKTTYHGHRVMAGARMSGTPRLATA